nr:MAG TPA: hypothetical protein [Caudoviricetes sp.]
MRLNHLGYGVTVSRNCNYCVISKSIYLVTS